MKKATFLTIAILAALTMFGQMNKTFDFDYSQRNFSGGFVGNTDQDNSGRIGGQLRYYVDNVGMDVGMLFDGKDYFVTHRFGVDLFSKSLPVIITPAAYFEGKVGGGYSSITELRITKVHKNLGFNLSIMTGGKDVGFRAGGYMNLFDTKEGSEYALSKKQIWGSALCFAGGFLHGMRERYHADPYIFEKVFNFDPNGFYGHNSWKRKYKLKDDGTRDLNKEEKWRTSFSDFWHVSDIGRKGLMTAGTIVMVVGENKKWTGYLVDFGLSFMSASIGSWAGYAFLSHTPNSY